MFCTLADRPRLRGNLLRAVLVSLLSALAPRPVSADAGSNAALTAHLKALVASDLEASSRAIAELGQSSSPEALLVLQALDEKTLRVSPEGRALIAQPEGGFRDPVSGKVEKSAGNASAPLINNSIRRTLRFALSQLSLHSKDVDVRRRAAATLSESPSEDTAQLIEQALEHEADSTTREHLALALAQLDLQNGSEEQKLAAVNTIGESGDLAFKPVIERLLSGQKDPHSPLRQAARRALTSFERKELVIRVFRDLFYGLSLGSVLLLAALGLAITFGLMGVINMAHGEMLMLGAYATFVVQNLFAKYAPGAQDYYLPCAVPVAFLVCLLVGVLLERAVIRHLYGRPLETLLATWGISLGLIQTVRLIFGAQNVTVGNPSWLSGGVDLATGVVIPYARIATILFVVVVVSFVYYLLHRTGLGLQLRATTQNRAMARCMGIRTPRVDMLTFGLGSGVAGLGGVALSQLGNVGPELGQSYIVDSFMVVVLGGVGKLAGTVVAALGLGTVNKVLEPVSGAVLGKILVLAFIVLFIQRRPQGLFAPKGRAAEA